MTLFLLLTMITFVDAYKTKIVVLLLKFYPQSPEVQSKTREIKELERELNSVSMMNEFAKHIKIQRKIIKLKEERRILAQQHAFKIMKIRYTVITISYIVIVITLISLMWTYRSEPVVKLPPHWIWPIASLFDWSNHIPGYITVPSWVAISSSASKTIAKHF